MLDSFLAVDLTFEERVIGSLVIGIGSGILLLALPSIVHWIRARIDARTELSIDRSDRPIRIGTAFVQRFGQLAVLLVAVIGVLMVWEQWEVLDRGYTVLATTFPTLSRVGLTVVLVIAAYYVLNSVQVWVERTTGRARRFNEHDQEIIKRIIQLLVLLTTAFLVLLVWQIDVSGLFLTAGVLGVILGYAARDTLGSIVAGLVLMFSRPFEIGDWVIIGEEQGIVTDITIVNTRIRAPDGEHVIIPNTEINHRTIRNRSDEPRIRFAVEVGIDFETEIDTARNVALEALEELDIVADTPFPSVLVDRLEDSSVVLRVRFWVDRPNAEKAWKAEHKALEAITTAFSRNGVHIPYPHQRFVTEEKNHLPGMETDDP